MKLGAMFSGKYLGSADLAGPVNVTIEDVRVVEFESDEGTKEKPVLSFKGAKKTMVLNKTNFLFLQHLFGTDETDEWRGKRVQIFVDEGVTFQGRITPALRIRAVDKAPPPRPAPLPDREPGIEGEETPF